MILIDDNLEVCKVWETKVNRKYINVTENFNACNALIELYKELDDRANEY